MKKEDIKKEWDWAILFTIAGFGLGFVVGGLLFGILF